MAHATHRSRVYTAARRNEASLLPINQREKDGQPEKLTLLAGAWAPEDQIKKDQNTYCDRTDEIPGFLHITSGRKDSLMNKIFLTFPPA
jgi:hypothetical protein